MLRETGTDVIGHVEVLCTAVALYRAGAPTTTPAPLTPARALRSSSAPPGAR